MRQTDMSSSSLLSALSYLGQSWTEFYSQMDPVQIDGVSGCLQKTILCSSTHLLGSHATMKWNSFCIFIPASSCHAGMGITWSLRSLTVHLGAHHNTQ